MSCYEWEQGSITLPAAEYLKLRNKMAEFMNRRSEKNYEKALEVWGKVCAAGKGKRNFNWVAAVNEKLWPMDGRDRDDNAFDHNIISGVLIKREDWKPVNKKPAKPQKKAFAKYAQTKLGTLMSAEGAVTFDNKTKTIHWGVSENNHSCESAREHPVGNEFFRLLRYVTFTNRTGGYIIGNDEYNRDEGDGRNFIKDRFGAYADPKSKRYNETSLYR